VKKWRNMMLVIVCAVGEQMEEYDDIACVY